MTNTTMTEEELTSYYNENAAYLIKMGLATAYDADTGTLTSDYVFTGDMASGPTVSGAGGGGDFETYADGTVLQQTKWHYAAGGFYDKLKIISDGLLVTDADQTYIDAADEGHLVNYSKWETINGGSGSHHYSNYHYYTAIDASNASGYVTYYGVTQDHWQGETSLTSKSYDFSNVFKGGDYGNEIHGGNYGDTLIGGTGDDTFYAGDGSDLIYAVGGDNVIYAGAGNDTIFGGTGNDIIITGTGNNKVVLEGGDNLVIAQQNEISGTTTTTYVNTFLGGTGSDTYVIGNIPASVTTVSSSGYNGADILEAGGISVAGEIISSGMEFAASSLPVVGWITSGMLTMLDSLIEGGASTTTTTTSWATDDESKIYNFNPVTDKILLPTNSAESDYIYFDSTTSGSGAYDIVARLGADGTAVLDIDYASGTDIFGAWHSSTLTYEEKAAFNFSLTHSSFAMDETGVYSFGTWTDASALTSFVGNLSEEVGTNSYAAAGAWSGYIISGTTSQSYIFGSQNSDALFGYDFMADDATPGSVSHKYFGFSGDNLFGPNHADDTIIGGTGDNTITFQDYIASETLTTVQNWQGIYADMSVRYEQSSYTDDDGNLTYGTYYNIEQMLTTSETASATTMVFQVENIVGSHGDDILIGDSEDNTFYSTGGENTWTGGDGNDTFYLTGGSATVTDFNADEDTVMIRASAYGGSGADYADSLEWVQSDTAWILQDEANGTLLTLKVTDAFDEAASVTIVADSGDTYTLIPDVVSASSFAFDAVA